jgi:hypothetical protein
MRRQREIDDEDEQHNAKKIRIDDTEDDAIINTYDDEINQLQSNKQRIEEEMQRKIDELRSKTSSLDSIIQLVKKRKEEYLLNANKNTTIVTTQNQLDVSMLSSDVVLNILQYYELTVHKTMDVGVVSRVEELVSLSKCIFGYFDNNHREIYTIFSSVNLHHISDRIINDIIRIRGIRCISISSEPIFDLSPEKPQTKQLNIDTRKYSYGPFLEKGNYLISFNDIHTKYTKKYSVNESSTTSILYAIAQQDLPQKLKQRDFTLYSSGNKIVFSNSITIRQLIDQKVIIADEFSLECGFSLYITLHPGITFDHIHKLSMKVESRYTSNYTIKQFISCCPNLQSFTSNNSDYFHFSELNSLRFANFECNVQCSKLDSLYHLPQLQSLKCRLNEFNNIKFNLNPNLTNLDLTCALYRDKSFTDDFIHSIFTASKLRRLRIESTNTFSAHNSASIASNTSITDLNIADNSFWINCFDKLAQNRTIKRLTISSDSRSYSGDKFIQIGDAITDLLMSNGQCFIEQLEYLKLHFFNDQIAELLEHRAKNLITLNVQYGEMSLQSMIAVCNLPKLTHLTITQVSDEMMVPLFLNTNITYLNLSGNMITLKDTSIYCLNSTIKTLILSKNLVTEETIIQLLKMKSLTYLDVSKNISKYSYELEQAISQNKNLHTLILGKIRRHFDLKKVGQHILTFEVFNYYDDDDDDE